MIDFLENAHKTSTKPKVTIGVCVKNSATTLTDAVRSIMAQDFPHDLMEVIFVNDGSTDETLSIIEDSVSKMDMYTRVFNTEWQGLGRARNIVVNSTSAEYIIWVDGDMLLPKNHVSKQLDFMEKNPLVCVAKARYAILPRENLLAFLENAGYVAVDYLYGGKPTTRSLGTGGSIYRVKPLRKIGGFDTQISGTRAGEDSDVEFRLREAGWLLYLASPALFYERRRSSILAILREYFWFGCGGYYIYRKSPRIFSVFWLTPLAGLAIGSLYATAAYRVTYRKSVLALPFMYAFKRTAWICGFVKEQLNAFQSRRYLLNS